MVKTSNSKVNNTTKTPRKTQRKATGKDAKDIASSQSKIPSVSIVSKVIKKEVNTPKKSPTKETRNLTPKQQQ